TLEVRALDDIRIDCDRDRILQVLANLVGNAVKFTPAKGSVSLSVERDEVGAKFSVEDDGPGIPPAKIEEIWTRFSREDRSAGGGHGLGLFIAKSLVEAHGGRIWVENRTTRSGATFCFTIPERGAALTTPPH